MMTEHYQATAEGHETAESREQTAERVDTGETDAPTSGEENEGLSTVLSADPLAGVQKDESEE